MDSNLKTVRDAFKNFSVKMDNKTQAVCEMIAQQLVTKAITTRVNTRGAHDFTGNLLGSIVSAVYKDGRAIKVYASIESGVRMSRYYEMTASHGRYYFKVDYSGQESVYKPTVETGGNRKGIDDVYDFVTSYTPQRNGYVIVLAYTAAYAEWVERERHTTGYLATLRYAPRIITREIKYFNKE